MNSNSIFEFVFSNYIFAIRRANILFINTCIALKCVKVVGVCLVHSIVAVEHYIRRWFSVEIHGFERKIPELFISVHVVLMSD